MRRRVFQLILIFSLFSFFVSCAGQSSVEKHIPITIKQYESYAITDMDELEATLVYNGESTDDTVATLLQGKWIYGNSEGNAEIIVKDADKELIFDVTVINNPECNFEDINEDRNIINHENIAYIGYCYNVFSGKEFNQSAVSEMKEIFDWNKVLNSGYLRLENDSSFTKTVFGGKNEYDYFESLSKKISATISVKFFKWKLYDKTWSDETSNSVKNHKISGINKLFIEYKKRSYFLERKGKNTWYYNFLLDKVKEDLFGYKQIPVNDFIKNYGTHVAVGTNLGQSFELNYIISDSPRSYKTVTYGENREQIEVDVRTYNEDFFLEKHFGNFISSNDSDKNLSQIISTYFSNNANSDGSIEIIGGGDEKRYFRKENCNDEMASRAYAFIFYPFIKSEDYYALISPRDSMSLVPVWDLIPNDTVEGKARIRQFTDYMNEKKEK